MLAAASVAAPGAQAVRLPSAVDAPTPQVEWGANQARPPAEDQSTGTASPALVVSSAAGAATTPDRVFHGSGWGHGLGMSQYGANEMAKAGRTAQQILATYYSGITYDAVDDSAWVNVNIAAGPSTISATSSALSTGGGPFTVTLGGTAMLASGPATVSFSISSGLVTASCAACSPQHLTGGSASINWDRSPYPGDRTLMQIAGRVYRDGVAILTPKTPDTLNAVMQVRVHDEYLDYIAESPWSWPQEALKAQAAAARGYVLSARDSGLRSACDCHVYNTTQDQVYGGYSTVLSNGNQPYWAAWRAAVRAAGAATTGYVPRYGGKYIQALYSSSSGGRTENNEDVWFTIGAPIPAAIFYLRGVADPWSLGASNPNRAWRQLLSGASLASVFGLSDVARLDLRDRTVNGGVHTATATSSSGSVRTLPGDRLRAISATPGGAVKSTMIRRLTGRLSGADRYSSATAVARHVAETATTVVVAAGDSALSDASVAGPLAATVGGPLLLTRRDQLPIATVTELNRRGSTVTTAYVVGGTGAVGEAVATQLRQRGVAVTRLAGRDRYDTSALVAKAIRSKRSTPTVVVAGGNGLADALGASGPASALREPIVLTQQNRLTPVTAEAIKAIGATASRIVGGTAVVGGAVESELNIAGITSTRLAGKDRYESSAAIAEFYRSRMPAVSEAVLTSGGDAALVDSLVAGTLEKLMVLTQPSVLVEPAAKTLQSSAVLETVTAVGGTGVLTDGVLSAAATS